MAEERIQKIMAEQGLCSRRAAEQIIAEGRVKVNGHPVKVGDNWDMWLPQHLRQPHFQQLSHTFSLNLIRFTCIQ